MEAHQFLKIIFHADLVASIIKRIWDNYYYFATILISQSPPPIFVSTATPNCTGLVSTPTADSAVSERNRVYNFEIIHASYPIVFIIALTILVFRFLYIAKIKLSNSDSDDKEVLNQANGHTDCKPILGDPTYFPLLENVQTSEVTTTDPMRPHPVQSSRVAIPGHGQMDYYELETLVNKNLTTLYSERRSLELSNILSLLENIETDKSNFSATDTLSPLSDIETNSSCQNLINHNHSCHSNGGAPELSSLPSVTISDRSGLTASQNVSVSNQSLSVTNSELSSDSPELLPTSTKLEGTSNLNSGPSPYLQSEPPVLNTGKPISTTPRSSPASKFQHVSNTLRACKAVDPEKLHSCPHPSNKSPETPRISESTGHSPSDSGSPSPLKCESTVENTQSTKSFETTNLCSQPPITPSIPKSIPHGCLKLNTAARTTARVRFSKVVEYKEENGMISHSDLNLKSDAKKDKKKEKMPPRRSRRWLANALLLPEKMKSSMLNDITKFLSKREKPLGYFQACANNVGSTKFEEFNAQQFAEIRTSLNINEDEFKHAFENCIQYRSLGSFGPVYSSNWKFVLHHLNCQEAFHIHKNICHLTRYLSDHKSTMIAKVIALYRCGAHFFAVELLRDEEITLKSTDYLIKWNKTTNEESYEECFLSELNNVDEEYKKILLRDIDWLVRDLEFLNVMDPDYLHLMCGKTFSNSLFIKFEWGHGMPLSYEEEIDWPRRYPLIFNEVMGHELL